MGIVTAILVVAGIIWFFSKGQQDEFGLLVKNGYQMADITRNRLDNSKKLSQSFPSGFKLNLLLLKRYTDNR